MQFLPPRQCSQRHTFTIGAHTQEVTDSYNHLNVHFCSGNPPAYMTVALHNLDCSYARMRRQYHGMACGCNVQLQLCFFDVLVTFSALWDGALGRPQQHRPVAKEVRLPPCEASEATVRAPAQHPYGVFPVRIRLAFSA